jgi:hypothetical protein
LLMMWCLHKDVLNICAHLGIAQYLITFVNHEEFALLYA